MDRRTFTGNRYRSLVELSPDGIFITEDARVVFLNPAAVRLFGAASADQVIGRTVFELFHPGWHDLIRDRIRRLVAGEPAPLVEQQIVRLDGVVIDVEVTSALLDSDGSAMQVIVRDLTERKRTEKALRESEERLTLAFAGAQEGVYDWNVETGAVFYSPRWIEMLGYAPDEIEPHVRAWERLLHPDDSERARGLIERVRRGEQDYRIEFRLRHKNGHYVDILSRGYAVRRTPDGPVVRLVGTHFDLTERKRSEEMLRRAHEELEARVRERTAELAQANASLREEMEERERAERSRRELLSRLVFAQEDERRRIAREMHDQFGEQLTALSRQIGQLEEACADTPALAAKVDELERLVRGLDRDVDQLVWQIRPTALDDLGLRAALANYVQDWSQRVHIAAELHSSGLLDDRLAPDAETTLFRIAQEALTNVAKHSQATGVEVILERRADHVLLIVEDDGIGFDPAACRHGPHGLGLLGMQERAALVGATLQIESAPNQGTSILLRMAATSQGSVVAHA